MIEAAHINGGKWLACEDPTSGQLTYKRLLQATRILGAKLMPLAPEGHAVGVMLPTSNGAAVTVLALLSGGRVPAMINFTAGAANILGACRAAEVDTILTAHAFVEKARLEKLIAALDGKVRIVYLEDVRKTVSFSDKLWGALRAKKPLVKRKPDDRAVILFTSGTEGVPKGVVLSHRNVLANVAQAEARIDFGREDTLVHGAAGIPLLRVHGRHRAAAHFRRADLFLSLAAALPHRPRIGLRHLRHLPVRHRYVSRRLRPHGQPLRLPLAALRDCRRRTGEGIRRGRCGWKNSVCAFSKAMA